MTTEIKEFEGIVKEALGIIRKDKEKRTPKSPCLSDELIVAIVEGPYPKSQLEYIMEHLLSCDRCCSDLKVYFDLVSTQKEKNKY